MTAVIDNRDQSCGLPVEQNRQRMRLVCWKCLDLIVALETDPVRGPISFDQYLCVFELDRNRACDPIENLDHIVLLDEGPVCVDTSLFDLCTDDVHEVSADARIAGVVRCSNVGMEPRTLGLSKADRSQREPPQSAGVEVRRVDGLLEQDVGHLG